MRTQLAVIITPEQLDELVEQRVCEAINKLKYDLARHIPAREYSCKEAAEILGVSESTFHAKFSQLKTRKGNRVFVKAGDLVGV